LRTLDRAGSNYRSFNADVQGDPKSNHLLQACEAHIVSTIQQRAMDPLELCLSGAVNFGLAQQTAGATKQFRQQLIQVLVWKVSIIHGEPPEQPINKRIFCLLLADENNGERDAYLLSLLITSNDLFGDEITWHTTSRNPNKLQWAKDVATIIYPRSTGVFTRHRWVGNLQPMRRQALLTIGNLLRDVAPRWVAALTGKPVPPLGGFYDVDLDSECEDINPADLVAGVPRLPDGSPDWDKWNARQRVGTKIFAASSPGLTLLTAIVTSQPQVRLLASVLARSGEPYVDSVYAAWVAGSNDDKELPIINAALASSSIDHSNATANLMFDSESYAIFPARARTLAQSTHAFVILSRGSCAQTQLLQHRRLSYPSKLFLLGLEKNEEAVQSILVDPSCLWDRFATQFFAHFDTEEKLRSQECMIVVLAIAILTVCCIRRTPYVVRPPITILAEAITCQDVFAHACYALSFTCMLESCFRGAEIP
jgi:hypothetical protein